MHYCVLKVEMANFRHKKTTNVGFRLRGAHFWSESKILENLDTDFYRR